MDSTSFLPEILKGGQKTTLRPDSFISEFRSRPTPSWNQWHCEVPHIGVVGGEARASPGAQLLQSGSSYKVPRGPDVKSEPAAEARTRVRASRAPEQAYRTDLPCSWAGPRRRPPAPHCPRRGRGQRRLASSPTPPRRSRLLPHSHLPALPPGPGG